MEAKQAIEDLQLDLKKYGVVREKGRVDWRSRKSGQKLYDSGEIWNVWVLGRVVQASRRGMPREKQWRQREFEQVHRRCKNSNSMAERIDESQTLERMNADSQMLEEGSNAETRT